MTQYRLDTLAQDVLRDLGIGRPGEGVYTGPPEAPEFRFQGPPAPQIDPAAVQRLLEGLRGPLDYSPRALPFRYEPPSLHDAGPVLDQPPPAVWEGFPAPFELLTPRDYELWQHLQRTRPLAPSWPGPVAGMLGR